MVRFTPSVLKPRLCPMRLWRRTGGRQTVEADPAPRSAGADRRSITHLRGAQMTAIPARSCRTSDAGRHGCGANLRSQHELRRARRSTHRHAPKCTTSGEALNAESLFFGDSREFSAAGAAAVVYGHNGPEL